MQGNCILDRVDQILRHLLLIAEGNIKRHWYAKSGNNLLQLKLQVLANARACICNPPGVQHCDGGVPYLSDSARLGEYFGYELFPQCIDDTTAHRSKTC